MSSFTQAWEEEMLEKSTGDLLGDYEWLSHIFASAAENGEGISTKDTIRMNYTVKELKRRGVVGLD